MEKGLQFNVMTTHGLSNSKTYNCWSNIKQRCLNPDNPYYEHYGGRGIKLYPLWVDSFEDFYAHVGDHPGKGFELDRVNNDGDYEPGNIRWVKRKFNLRNRRNTTLVEYMGETKSLGEWCEELNLNYDPIRTRYNKGIRGAELFKPVRPKNKNGQGRRKRRVTKPT